MLHSASSPMSASRATSRDLSPPTPERRANRRRSAVALVLGSLLAGSATAQSGDTCAEAIALSPPFSFGGGGLDFTTATASGLGSACASSAGWADLWYTFTIPSSPGATSAELSINHFFWNGFGSYSGEIALYRGSDCALIGPATLVECIEVTAFSNDSLVEFVTIGQTYTLRIAVDQPVSGVSIGMSIAYGTECAGIQTITFPGVTMFDPPLQVASTTFSCGVGFDRVRWFSYSARCNGTLELDTCDSDFDAALEIYSSGAGCGTLLACSDSGCGTKARISLPVTLSQQVRIRVGGRSGSAGVGRLRISEPAAFANFICSTAVPVEEGAHEFAAGCLFPNFVAGVPPCGPGNFQYPTAWYRYTARSTGTVRIDACGSDFPVTLHVTDGCTQFPLPATLHCSDSGCGASGASGLPYDGAVTAGDELYVRLYVRVTASQTAPLVGSLRLVVDEVAANELAVCDGMPNSTGAAATLQLFGDGSLVSNDLRLRVTSLPQSSFGFFVTSRSTFTLPNPGGSQGDLCIASLSMGRYPGLNSGLEGVVAMDVDVTALPVGGLPVVGAVGETWYWQYWYRDMNPTSTSNFSAARGLVLQ